MQQCQCRFSATKWIHVAHVAMGQETAERVEHVVFAPPPPPAPTGCKDAEYACKGWADSGECESNPGFMVGTKIHPGRCLLSCGRCDLMA
jgi:prolyl 4-hydroxylase